jgi:hypothetical protein
MILADIPDSILTPSLILWALAALIAASLLFGAINRRRGKLTDALRDYVDRNQMKPEPVGDKKSKRGAASEDES